MKPTDKRNKKLTRAQQEEVFKKSIAKEMQSWYIKGIAYGSNMQCSTILDIYKKMVDETPKSKQTKAFYVEIVEKIFKFCERGTTSDIGSILNSHTNLNEEVEVDGETEEA